MQDTLLHEILHMIEGFNLTTQAYLAKKTAMELEETIIRHWTPSLIAVLRDNPELVDYLLS
jgi:hypothetical protein